MNEWISVKDRLPDDDGHFLVAFRTKGTFIGWFYHGAFLDQNQSEFGMTEFGDDLTVTHWMPLPEPPL